MLPRVLHLITALERGGIERWLLSLLARVPRDRCVMDVCCKGPSIGSLAQQARDCGASVLHCRLRASQVGFLRDLTAILRSGQYNLVHNHLHTYSGLPVLVSRKLGLPIITSFHNTEFAATTVLRLPVLRELRRAYEYASITYALRNSTAITGCSQAVIQSVFRGYPTNGVRSAVLYYGIDLPPLAGVQQRSAFRESFGWAADTPVIVHVGRFVDQKNHFGLLSIFERVRRSVPAARLLLAGAGPLQSAVEAAIRARGLYESVRLLGLRDDIPSLLSCCDLFLFPSKFEGLPLAALEAGAAGLPVVGSDIPGLSEAVKNGRSGLLHAPDDTEGMAESAVAVLTDRDYAQGLGLAARARVRERFSVDASARRLLDLYDECISQH